MVAMSRVGHGRQHPRIGEPETVHRLDVCFRVAAFVLLVAAGVTARLALVDLPNFAPVAALALFAGYIFRSRFVALLVPLTVMCVSDAFLGGYSLIVTVVVYASLSLPVACRGLLRKWVRLEGTTPRQAAASVLAILACSLGASLLFFVATHLAVWSAANWYEHSPAGLAKCLAAGLPFFRYTLMGDLAFAAVFFGGHAVAVNVARMLEARRLRAHQERVTLPV
jgi:hypothetical protein